jgi:hypothetical protein
MASWQLIERTGQTLVRLLEQRIAEVGIGGVQVMNVSTGAFDDLEASSSPIISLMLYQVMENSELRNARKRVLPDGRLQRQPLALELCYLVTPWGARASETVNDDAMAAAEEARLLGLILQTFYNKAELGTADLFEDPAVPVWHAGDGLQIVLESLPVEDHYRIWDASELGYRLSVTYRVRVASLEALEHSVGPPVVEATFGGAI